jgi:YbgC/YbaW family acyl-CoA thioester hydrolase
MGFKYTHRMRIEWGDTDPARIVYYPQYFRWFDVACHHMFEQLGLSQSAMAATGGTVMPIVEAHGAFRRPGYPTDRIEVRAEITEVGRKVIKIEYQVWRDDVLLAEGYEKRVLAVHDPDDPQRMRAQEISDALRERIMDG